MVHYLLQEGNEQAKDVVVHIVVPGFNPYSIQRCRIIKVFGEIIDYYGSWEVTAEVLQVFDCVILMRGSVLSVKAMLYFACSVDVVEDPIGIVWHRGGKYYYLVIFTQLWQEAKRTRSNHVVTRLFWVWVHLLVDFEMDESLVKVEDESVDLVGVVVSSLWQTSCLLKWWQVWNGYLISELSVFEVYLFLVSQLNLLFWFRNHWFSLLLRYRHWSYSELLHLLLFLNNFVDSAPRRSQILSLRKQWGIIHIRTVFPLAAFLEKFLLSLWGGNSMAFFLSSCIIFSIVSFPVPGIGGAREVGDDLRLPRLSGFLSQFDRTKVCFFDWADLFYRGGLITFHLCCLLRERACLVDL